MPESKETDWSKREKQTNLCVSASALCQWADHHRWFDLISDERNMLFDNMLVVEQQWENKVYIYVNIDRNPGKM